MRFRRLTSALLVLLAGSLFVTTSVASAGPKEDVAAATIQWAQTLGQNDPPLPRAARGKGEAGWKASIFFPSGLVTSFVRRAIFCEKTELPLLPL